jgi:hypothetical protein
MRPVNLSTFLNFGRTLYFGGGASAPPPVAPPPSPPKADTPDNTAQSLARNRQGLQSTLLTGGANGGSILGGSGSTLGASFAPSAVMGQPNQYGGQN